MAKNYEKVAQAWTNTTRDNPYKQEIEDTDSFWKIDNFLAEVGYIREILEDVYVGMNLSKCSERTLDKLWAKLGSEQMFKDWVEYNGKEDTIKQEFNLWWWTENDRSYYSKEEE